MTKNFLNAPSSAATDTALLIARVGVAGLMLTHGLPKLAMLFSGGPVKFPSVMGMSPAISLGLTVFAEVFCSVLLFMGLATRIATIPMIITMLVAAFVVHAADPLAVKEPALQYLLVYLVLLFTGAGKYSLDYMLQGVASKSKYPAAQPTEPALQWVNK